MLWSMSSIQYQSNVWPVLYVLSGTVCFFIPLSHFPLFLPAFIFLFLSVTVYVQVVEGTCTHTDLWQQHRAILFSFRDFICRWTFLQGQKDVAAQRKRQCNGKSVFVCSDCGFYCVILENKVKRVRICIKWHACTAGYHFQLVAVWGQLGHLLQH